MSEFRDKCIERYAELIDEFEEEYHPSHGGTMQQMLIERLVQLEAEVEKAIELLIGWLISDDEMDITIHTDKWLRNKCNCENELPPCKICEALQAGGE